MSADNYYVVAQHPKNGRWYALMGFASDDEFVPNVHDDWSFGTESEALNWAFDQYSEYGTSSGDWPALVGIANACTTCRGADDECDDCHGSGFGEVAREDL